MLLLTCTINNLIENKDLFSMKNEALVYELKTVYDDDELKGLDPGPWGMFG